MNEEEKEAIELLKQEPDYSLGYYKREKAINVALNYIEKLKEENIILEGNKIGYKLAIQELKEELDYYKQKERQESEGKPLLYEGEIEE